MKYKEYFRETKNFLNLESQTENEIRNDQESKIIKNMLSKRDTEPFSTYSLNDRGSL